MSSKEDLCASMVERGVVRQRNFHNPVTREDRGYSYSRFIPSLVNQGESLHCSRNKFSKSRSSAQPSNSNISSRVSKNCRSHNNHDAPDNLVRGPRANRTNNSLSSSSEKIYVNNTVRRDNYNKSVFEIKYEHAKFFMIKSYNEDDIHKSIKYNVWTSTQNGNLKLDSVYWDLEKVKKEKGTKCPIFLFFSVNLSGQFVGLAEMIGPVDRNKSLDFWQEERWHGFFPVTWHIIKDIPNRLFQSITLENNDNQLVTYSRDTQEIGLPQGLRMLHIFKSYPLRPSILDDFEFYEKREKLLLANRQQKKSPECYDEFDEYEYGGTSIEHLEDGMSNISVSAVPRRSSNFRSLSDARRNYSKCHSPTNNSLSVNP